MGIAAEAMENIECLKLRLREIAIATLESPEHKKDFECLLNKFRLSREEIIETILKYTFAKEFSNEDYSSMNMRFVLYLHNVIPYSYHQQRQSLILSYLNKCRGSIIDMGFGVPQQYVFDLLENDKFNITLADKDEAAIFFAKALFKTKNSRSNKIQYKLIDMNKELPGKYDTYLFLDSIEHIDDSRGYLKKTVELADKHSQFIFALPITDKDSKRGMHSIEWRTDSHALNWLQDCGLVIEEHKSIIPNKEVDFFAFIDGKRFHNLIVRCGKKN